MSNDPSSDATRQLIQGMLTRLEQSGVEMQGLALDDLADAMSHPLAARTVVLPLLAALLPTREGSHPIS